MKKKKVIKLINLLFIILCFLGVIFSLKNVLSWKISNKENEETFKEIDKIINESIITNEENETVYDIDFESLKKQNSDVVGYLKVNNTKIDYVVVKGKDNDYYLRHNLKKKSNVAGWVFADYRNKFDGSDKNIIIYGHNMRNGSMFGSLKKILNKKWYKNEDNHIINFVTEEGTFKYRVFSVYSIPVEEYYIRTSFKNDNEFYKFIKKLKSRSIYNFGVDVNKDDKILTLSTCTANSTKRVVLHAKLIEE